jgi:hypothetical protein
MRISVRGDRRKAHILGAKRGPKQAPNPAMNGVERSPVAPCGLRRIIAK